MLRSGLAAICSQLFRCPPLCNLMRFLPLSPADVATAALHLHFVRSGPSKFKHNERHQTARWAIKGNILLPQKACKSILLMPSVDMYFQEGNHHSRS